MLVIVAISPQQGFSKVKHARTILIGLAFVLAVVSTARADSALNSVEWLEVGSEWQVDDDAWRWRDWQRQESHTESPWDTIDWHWHGEGKSEFVYPYHEIVQGDSGSDFNFVLPSAYNQTQLQIYYDEFQWHDAFDFEFGNDLEFGSWSDFRVAFERFWDEFSKHINRNTIIIILVCLYVLYWVCTRRRDVPNNEGKDSN